jgi:tRNA-guanine family transglycosylase
MLGARLVSLHNLTFMVRFVRAMREAILADGFGQWSRSALARYRTSW